MNIALSAVQPAHRPPVQVPVRLKRKEKLQVQKPDKRTIQAVRGLLPNQSFQIFVDWLAKSLLRQREENDILNTTPFRKLRGQAGGTDR